MNIIDSFRKYSFVVVAVLVLVWPSFEKMESYADALWTSSLPIRGANDHVPQFRIGTPFEGKTTWLRVGLGLPQSWVVVDFQKGGIYLQGKIKVFSMLVSLFIAGLLSLAPIIVRLVSKLESS